MPVLSFINPTELVHELGPAMAAASVCTMLFIANTIQINRLKDAQTKLSGDMRDKFSALQRAVTEGLQGISKYTEKLADEHQEFVSRTSQDNREIATTLVNLTNSIDKVVVRLIEVIKEVEKT